MPFFRNLIDGGATEHERAVAAPPAVLPTGGNLIRRCASIPPSLRRRPRKIRKTVNLSYFRALEPPALACNLSVLFPVLGGVQNVPEQRSGAERSER